MEKPAHVLIAEGLGWTMCCPREDGKKWVGVPSIRPSDPGLWWWLEVPRFDVDWKELEMELKVQAEAKFEAARMR